MITPMFKVDQNDKFIFIDIHAKYVKANEVETLIDGNCFHFYVKPYFLKLNLPGKLKEDGQETGNYDVSEGIFHFKVPKETEGEHFTDLDMLTSLLSEQKKFKKPLIEEIESEKVSGDESNENEDFLWDWKQELPVDYTQEALVGYKYGFANQLSDVFSRFQDELEEFIDIRCPEKVSYEERTVQRKSAESEKFNVEHYLADFFEEEKIEDILNFTAQWQKEISYLKEKYDTKEHGLKNESPFSGLTETKLNDEENEILLKLPNKNYILSQLEERQCLLGLVDILFAYCYNFRTTEAENTSESAWTICKLSATLSWFIKFETLHEVLVCSYRRSLCYPLYRNWKLLNAVLKDVKAIVSLGKIWIVRCLLEVRNILQSDDRRFIFNDLYITDYIVWIQKINNKKLTSLSKALEHEKVTKFEMEFNLDKIEMVFSTNEDEGSISSDEVDSSDEEENDTDNDNDERTNAENEELDSDDEPNPL